MDGPVISPDRFNGPKPGEEDTALYMHPWLQGLFGMLYTVSKEKGTDTATFVIFRYSLDFVQLFLLVVNPMYGWDIPSNGAWKAASAIGLNWVVSAMGWVLYLALFYLMVFALLAVVVLCLWVGISFSNNQFHYVWPITFLRWYANMFFKVLEIASMSLLVIVLDCNLIPIASDPGAQFHHQEFPDIVCFQGAHTIHACVAIVSLIVFILLDTVMQMGELELNPLSKNLTAITHTKVEVQGFMLKVIMTVACSLVNDTRYLAIVYLASTTLLVYLQVAFIPNLNDHINYFRSGCYASVWYAAVIMTIIVYSPSDDPIAYLNTCQNLTIAYWAGMVPVGLLGAFLAWLRTYWYMVVVLNRFKEQGAGGNSLKPSKLPVKVEDAREIEILSRCCRVWVEEDVLDPDAVALAEQVIKFGIQQLPGSAYMIILYSSFLIDVQTSYQSGYSQLQSAKKANPSILDRFAIFAREQQHAQQSSGAEGAMGHRGPAVNLVSFVEYKKNYRLVVTAHREALQALRAFWAHLMQPNASLSHLTKAVRRIEKAVTEAEKVYRMVLVRHAANVKILRLYGKFLEDVKHDPWSASKWYMEADRHELAEEDAKNNNIFSELGIDPATAEAEGMGDLCGLLDMDNLLGSHNNRAVIVINAQCIVQLVNPAVTKVFGYAKNEMKGRNINMVIPSPFAEQHNQAVRNYVLTGKETVVGHTSDFLALSKFKSVFPVSLHVSKISGIGEDMLFMGVIEVIPQPPDVASIWVMMNSETAISVDAGFTDHFGFRHDDLLGAPLSKWLVDPEEVLRLFGMIRAELAGATALSEVTEFPGSNSDREHDHHSRDRILQQTLSMVQGRSFRVLPKGENIMHVVKNLMVRHRYLDPVPAKATLRIGGSGLSRYFSIQLNAAHLPGHLMVSNSRGALLHVSKSLATALKTSVQGLVDTGTSASASSAVTGLQSLIAPPFNHLHADYLATINNRVSPPPWSCRSGLSCLVMANAGTAGQEVKSFQIQMQTRETEKGEALQVSWLTETSEEQAMSERRVRLVLDMDGKVLDVLSGEQRVFGIAPAKLKGMVLGDFLDAFQGHYTYKEVLVPVPPAQPPPQGHTVRTNTVFNTPESDTDEAAGDSREATPPALHDRLPPEAAPAPNPPTPPQAQKHKVATPSPDLRKALFVMAERAKQSPWTSWRVGVMPSNTQQASLTSRLVSMGLSTGPQLIPAMMAVQSVEPQDSQNPDLLSNLTKTKPGTALEAEDPRAVAWAEKTQDKLVLVVDLWRTDTYCGVLELDSRGLVAETSLGMLHPPWLSVGAGHRDMLGQHVGNFLNVPQTLQASAFVNGEVGQPVEAINEENTGNPKSKGILASKSGLSRRVTRVCGPVTLLVTKHQVDGEVLELEVQAVRKPHNPHTGRGGGIYLVCRAANATCARPNLVQYILQQREAELEQSQQLLIADTVRRQGLLEACQQFQTGVKVRPGDQSIGVNVSTRPRNVSLVNLRDGPLTRTTTQELIASIQSPVPAQPLQAISQPDPSSEGVKPLKTVSSPHKAPKDPEHLSGADSDMGAQSKGCRSSIMDADTVLERVQQWVIHAESAPGDLQPLDGQIIASDPLEPIFSDTAQKAASLRQSLGGVSAIPSVYNAQSDQSLLPGIISRINSIASKGPEGLQSEDGDGNWSVKRGSEANENPPKTGEGSDSEPSTTDHGTTDIKDVSEAQQADYRRGKRFKKLMRLLGNAKVQARMSRFRWHSYGLVVVLVLVHLGLFILQHELLASQVAGINGMYNVGVACRLIGETVNHMQQLDVLYRGLGQAKLTGLTNMTDMVRIYNSLTEHASSIQMLYTSAYDGLSALHNPPDKLLSIWHDDVLNMTVYDDGFGNLTATHTMTSLWHAGNRFLAQVDQVRYQHDSYFAQHGFFWKWAAVQNVVTLGSDTILPALFQTMELYLEVVVEYARSIQRIQLIILILEGGFMPLVSFVYMWILAMEVTALRFNMYVVFILVPMGLIRQLACRAIVLGDDEDEGQDDVADFLAKGAGQAGLDNDEQQYSYTPGQNGDVTMKINMPTFVEINRPGTPQSISQRIQYQFYYLKQWIKPPVTHVTNRRSLKSSYGFALWMAWPNVFWAALNLALNLVAYVKMEGLDQTSAVLNIVNFVKARYMVAFCYAFALCSTDATTDPALKASTRSILVDKLSLFEIEYEAMMNGGTSVNGTAGRFELAQTGIMQVNTQEIFNAGAEILFNTHSCLRQDPSTCLAPENPYYQWVHNGLDRAVTEYVSLLNSMTQLPPTSPLPFFNSSQMGYIWETKPDIEGGLILLTDTFRASILSTYDLASNLHVVNLVVTIVVAFLLYWLMLRPVVVEADSESRRVAELLSQLPPEVAVEQCVRKALALDRGKGAEDDLRGTMRGGMSESGAGSLYSSHSSGADGLPV